MPANTMPTATLQRLAALGLVTVLAACSSTVQREPAAERSAGAELPTRPQTARITDGRIRADMAYIDSLQGRLVSLNSGGRPVGEYGMAKAQCWLEWALEEYHDNDRTGIVDDAASESRKLIESMEAGQPVTGETRVPATSTRLRPDLWARAAALRANAGFASPVMCANAATACLEVKLVEAGHDLQETGWRHARPTIGEAEQLAAQAEAEIAACAPLPAAAPAPPTPADGDDDQDGIANSRDECPGTAAGARVDVRGCEMVREVPLRFPGVNFENDSAIIKPESFPPLNEAAASMKRYPEIAVEVAGHTDSVAAEAYNLALSQRRAQAVADYLRKAGVPNMLTVRSYGESMPVADNATAEGRAKNRRVVLRISE